VSIYAAFHTFKFSRKFQYWINLKAIKSRLTNKNRVLYVLNGRNLGIATVKSIYTYKVTKLCNTIKKY